MNLSLTQFFFEPLTYDSIQLPWAFRFISVLKLYSGCQYKRLAYGPSNNINALPCMIFDLSTCPPFTEISFPPLAFANPPRSSVPMCLGTTAEVLVMSVRVASAVISSVLHRSCSIFLITERFSLTVVLILVVCHSIHNPI